MLHARRPSHTINNNHIKDLTINSMDVVIEMRRVFFCNRRIRPRFTIGRATDQPNMLTPSNLFNNRLVPPFMMLHARQVRINRQKLRKPER